jgi:hypothetical protein
VDGMPPSCAFELVGTQTMTTGVILNRCKVAGP